MPPVKLLVAAVVLCGLTASGCGAQTSASSTAPSANTRSTGAAQPTASAASPSASSAPPSKEPSSSGEPELQVSDGKPREARLTISKLDLDDLKVKPHKGSPDDAGGTKIQDGGIAASPYGPKGGVGPGGIGNYIITAHRSSSTRPFHYLPKLKVGDKVQVEAAGQRYTYRIVDTRIVSFRSKKSLAAQSAAVPGKPGVNPTQAMITLSTCRTPEDHAEGNFWSDRFHNPEHRIDKIGELVSVSPA